MVVRIQLTIKHIRGHTFTVEADAESEVLGLKVQIWESQKIPIESQRLVFSGKELADNVTLSQMNIGDNATIFLVESLSEIPQQSSETPQVTIEAPIQVMETPDGNICQQQGTGVVPVPVPINVNYFQPVQMDVETAMSEERIESVIALAYWARVYCVFGIIGSILLCFSTFYAILLLIFYICGYIGTRRISRCLLVFPMILCALFGFASVIGFFFEIFSGYFSYFTFLELMLGMSHLMLMAGFWKLIGRVSKLSCQEWHQTCIRIRANGCCCC